MKPLVSIGLPVYNGERYLKKTIQSILLQSYGNFELIIRDNHSVDETESICRSMAARDSRIRYYRSKKNLGAAPNFNKVFQLSLGKYFKWAAHDDLLERDYLQECVRILETDPTVVLCNSRVVWIDEEDRIKKKYTYNMPEAGSAKVSRRFSVLSELGHGCFDIFGLIRREVLVNTPLIASYTGSDRALLAEISLYGRFHRIPRELFLSRDHSQRSLRALKFYHRRTWWDSTLSNGIEFPWWRLLREYGKIVVRSPLKTSEKLGCYITLPRWIRHSWRFLLGDLQNGVSVLRNIIRDRGRKTSNYA